MEKEVTIEDLNLFFSNISYDYYNLHMAVIIAYYNHKFIPLTQKEIYNDIITRNDFKSKLRKSTGEKYTSINIRIKDILKKKKSIFKNINNNKRVRGAKYSIILNQVIKFWKSQASLMNKEKDLYSNFSSGKLENRKKYTEDKINDKMDNIINCILNEKIEKNKMNVLLSKKNKKKKI